MNPRRATAQRFGPLAAAKKLGCRPALALLRAADERYWAMVLRHDPLIREKTGQGPAAFIAEAISGCGGQVFFLHNRVGSMERMVEKIAALSPPGTRIEAGHGQMEEGVLEEVMNRFVSGQTDILVCTTIIESGLDIPNANTIFIDDRDPFHHGFTVR